LQVESDELQKIKDELSFNFHKLGIIFISKLKSYKYELDTYANILKKICENKQKWNFCGSL
jgi:hypothetical protein